MATKKVTSKNEFAKIAKNLTIQVQDKGYEDCAPVYEYRSGNFRCSIDTYKTTIEDQIANLKHAANCLDRYSITTPAELNRRSNRLQKAMVFINEHRHLIPFLTYMYGNGDYNKDASISTRLANYRKKHGRLPEEMDKPARSPKLNDIHISRRDDLVCVISQIPYLPKAWML